jgi:D-3-phosphoglycerate dehydrogenase
MKVLICDPTSADAIDTMRDAGLDVVVQDDISPEVLKDAIPAYDGIVVRSRTKIRRDVIDAATNLKVIVRGGVGLDNIDVAYAELKGIAVLNTPAASSISVAELTVGYLFALARSIPQQTASMKNGLWEKKKFKGTDLYGKTLGIVGMGRIGSEVAKRAGALGMKVVAYDPYVDSENGPAMLPLEEVLAAADYISLHLPHNDETHHMLGADAFGAMKDGVRIVNCARGGVVDEEALYDALMTGKVAGAALDVYETEPAIGHKLLKLDQVIGSPHTGASTREAQGRVGAEVAERMISFFNELD